MAFESQFTAGLESWTTVAAAAWNAANGWPGPGCVAFTHDTGTLDDGGSISIDPAYVVQTGDYISFYYRAVLSENICLLGYVIDCQVTAAGLVNLQPPCPAIGDSGWQVARASIESLVGETVNSIQIATINLVLNATGVIYVDNVRLGSALPDVVSIAQFYSGVDTLAYRSDLPFAGVNPGGMAVLQDRTVVLGSNAAAAQSVVFSQPESYPNWTDMTPVIPTGTSVTSIKNV